ncbi:hypothetical protein STAQ_19870 [Allostella sp. ATCC 35155]|nr:hypothetical protein STAQ_19870 [Stella sp. ATCC 35155]
MADWPPPSELDERTWNAARQALLAETARETVFAPHYKIVVQRAFDRIRAAIRSRRPLGTGVVYRYLRRDSEAEGASERLELAQAPVERTLLLLFGAAAAARAEPLLDRRRVFSALPPRPGESELVAPDPWCAAAYRSAVSAALARDGWTHAFKIDVARAGHTIDRGRFLADLAAAGLRPEWLEEGRRLDRALTPAMGPCGLPGSIGSGQMVTVALARMDEVCAAMGVPSFRLIDGLVALADGAAAAEAVQRRMTAELAGLGLEPNPTKTGISARAEFTAGWSDPVIALIDDATAAADPVAAARAAIADLSRFGAFATNAERWALLALGRARDPAGIELALTGLRSAPWAIRIHWLYLSQFFDDRAIAEQAAATVAACFGELHPWQRMWILAAFWTAPTIPSTLAATLPRLAADGAVPVPLRAAAAILWARIASRRGWEALENLVADSSDSYFRTAVAFGLRYRAPEERRTLLGRWGRRDPDVDLVATALEREISGL